MNKVDFGNLLRARRFEDEENKITQTECANVCGVCLEAYQKWERGLSFPKQDNLTKICEYLGIDESTVEIDD